MPRAKKITLLEVQQKALDGKPLSDKEAKMLGDYTERLIETIKQGESVAYEVVSVSNFENYPAMGKKSNLYVGAAMNVKAELKTK